MDRDRGGSQAISSALASATIIGRMARPRRRTAALGMSREILRQLRLRGMRQPVKHDRRWGCSQGQGPLQWHLENVEATITGWSRRNLQG